MNAFDLSILPKLLVFAFVASATPGPNTLMLLASGVNYGFSRTLPHMGGILLGFAALLLAVGLGLGALFKALPVLAIVLKVAGGAYLLWLAYRIATAAPVSPDAAEGRPLTVMQAAAFQWVNPKAWSMGISAMAIFTADANGAPLAVVLVVASFVAVSIPAMTLWAGGGTLVRPILSAPSRLRAFNITMGILLAATVVLMVQ